MTHLLLISKGRKPRKGKVISCRVCSKERYVRPSDIGKILTCSRICGNKWKGRNGVYLNCGDCQKQFRVPASAVKWGKIRGRKNTFCSRLCSGKFHRDSPATDSRNYLKEYNRAVRYSTNFKEWRKTVFERDNYTCQLCGIRNGMGVDVKLHPHHLKTFSSYPNLRFVPSNGKTLCEQCHRDLHLHFNCAYQNNEDLIWVR